jgi:hypothetical protein
MTQYGDSFGRHQRTEAGYSTDENAILNGISDRRKKRRKRQRWWLNLNLRLK